MKQFYYERRSVTAEQLNRKIESVLKRKMSRLHERFTQDDLIGEIWVEILIDWPLQCVYLEPEYLLKVADRVVKRFERIQQQEDGKSDLPSTKQLSAIEDFIGHTEPLYFNQPSMGRRRSSYLSYDKRGKPIDWLNLVSTGDTPLLLENTGNVPEPIKTRVKLKPLDLKHPLVRSTLKLLRTHKPSYVPRSLEDSKLWLESSWTNPLTGYSPKFGDLQSVESEFLSGFTYYGWSACPICLGKKRCFQLYDEERKGLKWKCWKFAAKDNPSVDLIPKVKKNMRTLSAIVDLQGRDDFCIESLKQEIDKESH